MRPLVQLEKLEALMAAMGRRVTTGGRIYLTGGATALLHGWRPMTVDVDWKADPEPGGFFEAIARLKDELAVNIELASPSDFIPEIPGWRERSLFVARHGPIDFYHYDPFSQALSKLERGHTRDLTDVDAMLRAGLIRRDRLFQYFLDIEPRLIRYPALDPDSFRAVVEAFCQTPASDDPTPPMTPNLQETLAGLPGADRILEGLADFQQDRRTIPACLVRIARPRLSRAGFMPLAVLRDDGAELELYHHLAHEGSQAHSRYNALVRELVSFEHALDHRLARRHQADPG